MSDLSANHISARVPGEETFLINPYGMLYEEITASSLIKIDHEGNVLLKPEFPGVDYGVNRAGFVIHSAIHKARHEVACVAHTHTWAGMAVSALDCGLLPITQTSMRFAQVAYHDYKGVVLDLDMQESLVRDLGEHDAMILRNHGLLTCGRTVAEAFNAPAPPRTLLQDADRRHVLRDQALRGAAGRGGRDLEELPAEDPPPLRRDGMAGDAAEARPHRPVLARLSGSGIPDLRSADCARAGSRRALALAAAAAGLSAGVAAAQGAPERAPAGAAPVGAFIEVVPTGGRAPVRIAAAQVVRVARADGYTVIDTTAWVQQRTVEPVEAVARRLAAAGQRLVALTDLRDARTYLAADRVVLVREPYDHHAAGARAAIVMVGLRFNTDVAVRETVEEVMAALGRDAAKRNEPAGAPRDGRRALNV